MRALAIALVLASLAGTARAGDGDDDDHDEDGEFVPMRKLSIALGIAGHGTRVGGQSESGFGTSLELAHGRHRWQYFVEGGLATARISPARSVEDITGRMLSAGLGARWLARQ